MAMPLTLPSSEAHAKCGPELDLTLKADQDQRHTVGGYYDAPQDNDGEDYSVSIKLSIPLGEDYCEEQEAQDLRRDRAYAHRAEIDVIEKKLRLCDKYGANHPLLKGQCK